MGCSWYIIIIFFNIISIKLCPILALRNTMLQHVTVTISSQSECTEFYKRLSPAPYTLDHYQMCSQVTEDMCIVRNLYKKFKANKANF